MRLEVLKYDRWNLIGIGRSEVDQSTLVTFISSIARALGKRAIATADCAHSADDHVWLFRRLEEISKQLENARFSSKPLSDFEKWSLQRSYEGTQLACALAQSSSGGVDFGWHKLSIDFAPIAERLWLICTHWAHFSDLLWGALFLQNSVKLTPNFKSSFDPIANELIVADLSAMARELFPAFGKEHLGNLDGLADHDPTVPIFEYFREAGKHIKGFDPILITSSCETIEKLLGSTTDGSTLLVIDQNRFLDLFADHLSSDAVRNAAAESERCFAKLTKHAIAVLETSEPALKAFPVFSSCLREVTYCEKERFLLLPRFGQLETMEFTHDFGKNDAMAIPIKAVYPTRRAYKDHLEKFGLPKCQLRKLFSEATVPGQLVQNGNFIFGFNVVQVSGLSMPSSGEDFDVIVIDCAQRRIRFAECKFRYAEAAFRYFRNDVGIVRDASKQIEVRKEWLRSNLPQFEFSKASCNASWEIEGAVITNQFPVGYFFASHQQTPNLAVLGSERARAFFLDGKPLI